MIICFHRGRKSAQVGRQRHLLWEFWDALQAAAHRSHHAGRQCEGGTLKVWGLVRHRQGVLVSCQGWRWSRHWAHQRHLSGKILWCIPKTWRVRPWGSLHLHGHALPNAIRMGWDFGALVQRGLNLYWHVWTIKGRGDGVGSAVTMLHVECCRTQVRPKRGMYTRVSLLLTRIF